MNSRIRTIGIFLALALALPALTQASGTIPAGTKIPVVIDQTVSSKTAKAGQTVKEGYEAVQQYAEDKGLDFDLQGFVQREPWLALAAAFAVGYTVAQIMRRVF